jgi:hypothetical protein
MKRLVFTMFIISLVFIVNCGDGGSGDTSAPDTYQTRALSWQARQLKCQKISTMDIDDPYRIPITGDLFTDVSNVVRQLPYIEYTYDQKDYWQSSQETVDRTKGDCDDMAILAYMALLDSELIDYYDFDLYLQINTDYDDWCHMVCIIQLGDQMLQVSNFWVSDYFLGDCEVVFNFDLYSMWL